MCVYQLSTFRHVRDIPSRFVEQHVRLRGCVKDVDHHATLYVQHIPILHLSRKSTRATGL